MNHPADIYRPDYLAIAVAQTRLLKESLRPQSAVAAMPGNLPPRNSAVRRDHDAHVAAWLDAETCCECNRSVSAAQLWPGTVYCKPCYAPIFLDALAQDRAEANGYRALAGRFA